MFAQYRLFDSFLSSCLCLISRRLQWTIEQTTDHSFLPSCVLCYRSHLPPTVSPTRNLLSTFFLQILFHAFLGLTLATVTLVLQCCYRFFSVYMNTLLNYWHVSLFSLFFCITLSSYFSGAKLTTSLFSGCGFTCLLYSRAMNDQKDGTRILVDCLS